MSGRDCARAACEDGCRLAFADMSIVGFFFKGSARLLTQGKRDEEEKTKEGEEEEEVWGGGGAWRLRDCQGL